MAKMIRKADAFEIINHWLLAGSCFLLAITGFGFLFHLEGVGAFFGGFNEMKVIHNWAGVAFGVALFFSIFFYLPVALRFGKDDIEWFLKGGGYISKKVTVPPQDKLNAGQKVYYLVLLAAGIAISVTGLIIWQRPETADIRGLVLLSHFLHNAAFDIMMIAIPMHIYLATLANPGTLRIMITGTVPLAWAKKRHAKWIERKGLS
ncbi:MAG: formate dehydrogenase subunit gamma [Thermodesulfovibrionales bacterium]|jgi:formate dehydrogenase subunit gamma